MLQFPAFMRQFPSPPLLPSSTLLPLWAFSHNDELLLAVEESELEDKEMVLAVWQSKFKERKWTEIRKINSSVPVIGKINTDYKEDFDADAEEDDPDNVDESEGDEFEQEAG